jgi:hypothetical protein
VPIANTNNPDAKLISAASRLAACHAGVIMIEKIAVAPTEEELNDALHRRFDAANAVADAPTARTLDGAAATARSLLVMCKALDGAEWQDSLVEKLIMHLAVDVANIHAAALPAA